MIENIKLKLIYQSQNSNGWPMIMIKINDVIVDRFQADEKKEWTGEYSLELRPENTLKIEHYGKNYITDQNPDKYFELEKIFVNQVDLKHHLYQCKQFAYLPPWDHSPPPDHSLYLGHNGYLKLEFTSPVNQWIQKLFGLTAGTMHGQSTTREVLQQVKNFFQIQ